MKNMKLSTLKGVVTQVKNNVRVFITLAIESSNFCHLMNFHSISIKKSLWSRLFPGSSFASSPAKGEIMQQSKIQVIQKLTKNLKLFGLNPHNWQLIQGSQSNQWYIINKKNRSLSMKGVSSLKDRKNPYWKDIELTSL